MNPLDEALALQALIDASGLTHAEVARRLNKSRSHVTNLLRLLTLPPPVQELVRSGQLKPGHARGVLRLRQPAAQLRMANRIVQEQLSVRHVERATPAKKGAVSRETGGKFVSREVEHLTRAVETRLGKAPNIHWKGSGGHLSIPFESPDQLAELLTSLLRS